MTRTSPWRVFASARPTMSGGPVLPMDRDDAAFWAGRERTAAERAARLESKGTRNG